MKLGVINGWSLSHNAAFIELPCCRVSVACLQVGVGYAGVATWKNGLRVEDDSARETPDAAADATLRLVLREAQGRAIKLDAARAHVKAAEAAVVTAAKLGLKAERHARVAAKQAQDTCAAIEAANETAVILAKAGYKVA